MTTFYFFNQSLRDNFCKIIKKETCLFTLLMLSPACKKAYNPSTVKTNYNYLVVEGFINTGQDSTIITLSRTVNISSNTTANPELNAVVTIEDDQNNSYLLNEIRNGRYALPALNLTNMFQYRLRIKTTNGQAYLSDFVSANAAPSIDSVGYIIQNNGVQVYLNKHDPTNSAKYYRWEYGETWIFDAAFESYYKIVNGLPVLRTAADGQDFQCWGHDTSSNILLSSTHDLSKDIVSQYPITFLPSTSEKIEDRYSILVKQYALTAAAYNYYLLLKQNTENLGGIFDAQPSQLTGNIHNINNKSEPVIGYISAGTVSEKRIYIDNRNLPAWVPVTFYDTYGCSMDTTSYRPFPVDYVPIGGKYGALYTCTDCTLRGSNKQPVFWTN